MGEEHANEGDMVGEETQTYRKRKEKKQFDRGEKASRQIDRKKKNRFGPNDRWILCVIRKYGLFEISRLWVELMIE